MTVSPLIVTGFSGAGMTSVLKALEDFHYEVFDNFPLALVDSLLEQAGQNNRPPLKIAIGIDTRTWGFSGSAVLDVAQRAKARLLFVTCDDAVLQKRFNETRRRHPLAKDRPVTYGIQLEKKLLAELQKHADILIDSTEFSIHDLRHVLEGHFRNKPQENMTVTLMSFGFRYGVPREADLVMDVRFLKNPHWDEKLKPLTGLDPAVGEYIRQDPDYERFMTTFKALLEILLPRYTQEGKNYLTVALGCTGGRHRSVYLIDLLAGWLREQKFQVFVENRDLSEG
ncbi:MAG: RNase adapter RapZ [Alphaproteobacteria bacterium]|nr:RNase adapter RapZ [Alphaproteobacteria bacterium]